MEAGSRSNAPALICKARPEHEPGLYDLISFYAKQNLMLGRTHHELLKKLPEYWVALGGPEGNTVVGCAGVTRDYDGLGEVRSLAVHPDAEGSGVGTRLVEACEQEAAELGYRAIFALTYIPEYFTRRGYDIIDKAELPQKIWKDCWKCPMVHDCNEIAVIRHLSPTGDKP